MGNVNVDVGEVETTLRDIPDVEAARVILGNGAEISEIHVLATPGRGPKLLVRDVESTLIVRFGLAIDHKKISVAQIGPSLNEKASSESFASNGSSRRARIVGVKTETGGVRDKVTVMLSFNGQELSGRAEGPATQSSKLRLVAIATLRAIEQLPASAEVFGLEDVAFMSLGGNDLVVSCVVLMHEKGQEKLAGSAVVNQSGSEAAARATLAATNRWFSRLTTL